MLNLCENGVRVVTGLDNYIFCSVTKKPCAFQRPCVSRGEVINTDGAVTCKGRKKKEVDDVLKNKDNTEIIEVAEDKPFAYDDKLELPLEYIPVKEEVKEPIREEVKSRKADVVKKEKGTVTLVSKTYVVYDFNGNSCYKKGVFDVKIGDEIEI